MRRAVTFSILLIVLLVLVACGGGAKAEPTAAPAQAESKPAAQASATQASKPVAPTATTAPVEEALPVLKPGALKSYVAQMEFKSEVVKPEAAIESWSAMEMTYRLDPAPVASAMVLKDKTGQGQADIQMIIIGEAMYFKAPEEERWTKLPTSGGGLGAMMQSMLDPEELTKDTPVDIFTAANVINRSETVDGVATTHYRATEAQLRALMEQNEVITQQQQKLISGTADFWVAKRGNYLKQYRTETLLEDEAGRQVKSFIQLLVTKENEPVTIEPPPADQVTEMPAFDQETPEPESRPTSETTSTEMPADLAKLPAPPQSEEYLPSEWPTGTRIIVETMAAQGPTRVFLSDASAEDIDAFYETEMPKLGYKSIMQQAGELGIAINAFMKGEQNVMIQILEDSDTGKRVVVMQMP